MERVDIILPVFNASEYLDSAIESLVNQEYSNIRVLIIDDGSTDNSLLIIKKWAKKYENIKYRTRENLGLIKTLNELLVWSDACYVARMDADDISCRSRIRKQVDYLSKKKDVGILATRVNMVDEHLKYIRGNLTCTEFEEIKFSLNFGNPISHPTVMFNFNVIDKNDAYYDETEETVEDFGLWVKLSKKYKIVNLKDRLLQYRLTPNGITRKKRNMQITMSNEILRKYDRSENVDYSKLHLVNGDFISFTREYLKLCKYTQVSGKTKMKFYFVEVFKLLYRKLS